MLAPCRYKTDDIYTWAGPVLIALNPCKNLPLYTPEVAANYKRELPCEGQNATAEA